jgi:hypothetical protein
MEKTKMHKLAGGLIMGIAAGVAISQPSDALARVCAAAILAVLVVL